MKHLQLYTAPAAELFVIRFEQKFCDSANAPSALPTFEQDYGDWD